jgi:sigma-B regulation protein RsbU (phosphoserine phosphatase)
MLSIEQYSSLINSIALLNSKLHIDDILDFVMKEITLYLEADRSTLYIVDRRKNEIWSKIAQGDQKLIINLPVGKGVAGWVAQTGKIVNIPNAYRDSRFNPEVDQQSGYKTKTILCVPVKAKNGRLLGVLQVLNKKNGIFSREDELFASLYAEHIAIAIQNALYLNQALKEQKLKKELRIAAEIQKFFMQNDSITLPEYKISTNLKNSYSLGGDFLDLWEHGKRIYFIVADAMGKGVGGALTMASLVGLISQFKFRLIHLQDWVQLFNTNLYNLFHGKKFITMIIGYLNREYDQIHYIRCGHVFPIHIRPLRQIPEFEILKSAGPPLGIQKNSLFDEKKLQLLDGDIFFCCSDGIIEIDSRNGLISQKELGRFLLANHYLSPELLNEELLKMVRKRSKNGDISDDHLIFMIKKRSKV